jgi:hypothetical protein
MKKTNVSHKNSELTSILNTHFKRKLNLARVKLISHFVIALCKVQTVTFEKLANAFDTAADSGSSLRRIQRFIANYSLDADLIARLVFNLLPEQENLILSIDRTNWKFGQTNINIFLLGVVYDCVAFPSNPLPPPPHTYQQGRLTKAVTSLHSLGAQMGFLHSANSDHYLPPSPRQANYQQNFLATTNGQMQP